MVWLKLILQEEKKNERAFYILKYYFRFAGLAHSSSSLFNLIIFHLLPSLFIFSRLYSCGFIFSLLCSSFYVFIFFWVHLLPSSSSPFSLTLFIFSYSLMSKFSLMLVIIEFCTVLAIWGLTRYLKIDNTPKG